MRQNMANIDLTPVEMNRGYQAIFVPTDVEYNQIVNIICDRKGRSEFGKFLKICCPHDFEPPDQPSLTVRVFFPEIFQCFTADDVHDCAISYSGLSLNSADVQITCFLPPPFGVGYGCTITY